RLLRALPALEIGDPPPAWFPTAGHGSAVGSVEVAADRFEVAATVELADLVTPALELDLLRAPVELRDGVFSTRDLLAVGPDQRLVASGRYDIDRERGRFDFELTTGDPGGLLRGLPGLDIGEPPPPWFPLAGRGTAAGSLELVAGEVAVSARLDLANVVTPVVDLTELSGPVELRGGVFSTTGLVAIGPEQQLTAAGSFDPAAVRGELDFHLVSQDLGAIAAFLPLPAGEPPPWLPTAGRGTVEASLVIAPGPTVTGRAVFDLAAVDTPSGRFDTVIGSLRMTPAAIRDLRLEASAGGGALIAAGDVPLPLDAGELDLAVEVVDFPLEQLSAFTPQLPALTGRVTARFDAAGTIDQVQGEASIDTGPVTIAGVEVSALDADVSFRGRRLVVDRLVAEMPAGTLSAVGTWNRLTGGLAFQAAGSGLALDRPPFSDLVPGDLGGRVTFSATVEGTVAEPRVAARLVGEDLELAGRPLGDEGVAAVNLRWVGEEVTARGSLLGLVAFDGGGRLTGDRADLEFQVASDDLGALIQLGLDDPVASDLTGTFAGTLTVTGPYGDGVLPDATLLLPTLTLAYEGRRIENIEPVAVRLADGLVTIDSLFLGSGDDSELFLVGSIGVSGRQALDLRLQADLDVAWLELLIPNVQLEGDIEALAVVGGTLSDPRFSGQAGLTEGEALVAGFPHAFEELDALALIYPGRIVLDHLTAEVAGGDLRAAGVVELVDLAAGRLDYRLQAQVLDVAVRFPEGFLLRGDAHLTLTTRPDGRLLAGSVDLERAFYLEDVPAGLGGLLQGVFQRSRLEVAVADEELAGTQLNVAVLGPDALRVRNNIANLEGDIDLVLRGTLARPVVLGQVEITAGGDVVYADNEYEVERGLLTFANPRRIDPVIDFVATTEVRSFDITLNLDGTIDRLNATFTSDPPLADLEIVSLLTTGQPIADSGRLFAGTTAAGPAAPGAAAQQFLYGQAASVISERVNTLFGFDRFRVAPVSASGPGQSSLAFTVGKQISRDLFVTYSRDPSTSDLDILQVEWEVRDNVVVVLTQRGDGSYAVDVQVERRF
ncbi:MAG TPA: translocation/assembly module TamB domain-containing protein, partial [Thermoanaerobaculia bacterium]|nr:translocation/assembly module TamB domain-containing protein [Thermoanaerobaculia bacterium]